MGINKFEYFGDTVFDISEDTVDASHLASGYTAHGKNGDVVNGDLVAQAAKTVTPTSSEQTAVASGRYTTGVVKVAAVPTQSKTATENGTITPDAGKFLSSVIVNVQGSGGGIAGVTELYSSDAVSITYTSTSAGTAKSITGISGLCTYPFIVVLIENTDTSSGKLKFVRSATVIGNINFAIGSASVLRYGTEHYYNSNGTLTNLSSTSYGLWGYTISTSSSGTLTIRGRCNGSYFTSLTGTYKVRVLGIKL